MIQRNSSLKYIMDYDTEGIVVQREALNYQNSKIYSIRCRSDPSLVFIDCTTQPLNKRFSFHKSEYKRWLADRNKKYNCVFHLLQHPDCYIELIEKVECNDIEHLLKIRYETIRSMDCINKDITKNKMV